MYYAIISNEIAIGEKACLQKYYKNIKELPPDYYERSYIVRNGELVVDESAEKAKAIEELDVQYNSDKAVLMSQYTEAVIDDDSELMASVKAELTALREQYDKDYEDIIGGAE